MLEKDTPRPEAEIIVDGIRAFTDQPRITVTIPLPPPAPKGFWQRLKDRFRKQGPPPPDKLVYELGGIKVDPMLLITQIGLSIPKEIFGGKEIGKDVLPADLYPAFNEHVHSLVTIVGIALLNNGQMPDEELKGHIRREFSNKFLAQISLLISQQMNMMDFLNCIVWTRGQLVLQQTSPAD